MATVLCLLFWRVYRVVECRCGSDCGSGEAEALFIGNYDFTAIDEAKEG